MKIFIFLIIILTSINIQSEQSADIFIQSFLDATNGKFGKIESLSGPGSTLEQTRIIRLFLPQIIQKYTITTIIDAPCGDFHWMQHVDLGNCKYIGVDAVFGLIEGNRQLYSGANRTFILKNLVLDTLECADLILCRDFLVHLSNADVKAVLHKFKESKSRYLLTTTFPNRSNVDIFSGEWRPLNLQAHPFNFPEPIMIINEGCTE